jgi:type 1 glutamine amidotransferase
MSFARRSLHRYVGSWLAMVLAAAVLAFNPAGAGAHEGHGHVLIFSETAALRHTEAIAQGTPILTSALEAEGVEVVHSEDSSIFNDADLAQFDAIMMFQTSGDPWTAEEKAALQRFVQAGGGISAVHNATDMRGNWDWWDDLVGTTMPGHEPTGNDPGLAGTVRVEDHDHSSTEHLDTRWQRADEWYNYAVNTRGQAHILATVDESAYTHTPTSNKMGYDHPISWCRPFDGGRTWVTGMGHHPSQYTNEPDFVQHIVKGTMWAAACSTATAGARSGRATRRSRWTRTPPRRSRWTSRRTARSSTPSWCAARSASTTQSRRRRPPRSPSRSTPAARTACSASHWRPTSGLPAICTSTTRRPAATTPTRPTSSTGCRASPTRTARSTRPPRRCCSRSRPGGCPTSPATPAAAWTSTPRATSTSASATT